MAKKGTNNSTRKSNASGRKLSNSKSSKTSSSKKTQVEEIEDPFFEDSSKEIILWGSIGLCILLCIGNFGIGGALGNAIAGTLFGVFGIIQYILPFMVAFSAFFLISNYGNKVATAKVIAGFILLIFISVFVELIIHGQSVLSPVEVFEYSRDNHSGGGIIAGTIIVLIFDSFGLLGAYLIDIIVMIVCTIIIVERFAFDKVQRSSQYHADRAAAKRRARRERMMLEREANQTRFNSDRQAIINKIEADKELEQLQINNSSGKRTSRKRTGITSNTTLVNDLPATTEDSDAVNEIRFNIGGTDESTTVTKTSRHKLKANRKSKSVHDFADIADSRDIEEGLSSSEVKESQFSFHSEEPVVSKTTSFDMASSEIKFSGSALMDEMQSETAISSEKSVRHSKPSVSSASEIAQTSESFKASIDANKSKSKKPYKYPPLSLLKDTKKSSGDSKAYLAEMAEKLKRTLGNFGVSANVTEVTLGPSVTRYEVEIAEGTRVSKVVNLTDDIKLNMAVTDVRIEAPIPGKSAIGIEVPNKEKTLVSFKELVNSSEFQKTKSKIAFCVGRDISGSVIIGNIEKMPHLLIAGATGSGKSVCINTIIMSILYHASPDEVKMIMVDPKMVELSIYNGIPHLLIPVVTDPKKAAGALHWAVKEMTDRYELLSQAGVRNIEGFNEKVDSDSLPDNISEDKRVRMPQIVIILDEVADLMMVAAADVEESIVRLAQLARAAGIHLVIATQKPTVNVITGLIKANVPSRIAFSVSSSTDSRVILDMNGAEDLLGNGDMLYAPQGLSKPLRVQGAFVTDEEVSAVVEFLKDNNESDGYNSEIQDQIANSDVGNNSVSISGEPDNSKDPLFEQAGRLVIENQKGSIGYLQRNFRIGFNRAARIMDQLAETGVVGPEMGTKPREIRMSISEFEEVINQ